ncbi:carbohydrate ABC transporter permease [Demequina mangrovi]|uniref:Carbohydrate ABC transporter membrane protein 1, CUT1 family n=1 Tax=Demequina mangrovi TaxID=1043493 RepID=A0A1H6WS35_9MICO|nr:sugar ABC transporter permease [Demequina mangrovi]SEJ18666.1 carbohydrate ABC transporter membrane protein 1, CUT1 family [Demequina mangrovi]
MTTTMTAPASSPARVEQPPRRRRRRTRLPHLLLIPAVGTLLIGLGYPVTWQILNSFKEYGLAQQFGQPAEYVGFANYIALFTDGMFWTIALRSVAFMAATAAVTMVIGIAFALLMKVIPTWSRIVLQVAMLLAWAMPIVAQMTVANWLIDDRNGVLNHVLSLIPGVDLIGHDWLIDPLSFFGVALVIITWASVPFVAFSVYAGLTQVSEEVLEAGQLDGASAFQMLRLIIMPIIRPVLVILILLQLIWDLRVFAQIQLLQDFGAAGERYDLLGTYIYGLGIGQGQFGAAAAAAMVVMILTLAVSWGYVRRLLKEDEES